MGIGVGSDPLPVLLEELVVLRATVTWLLLLGSLFFGAGYDLVRPLRQAGHEQGSLAPRTPPSW